MNSIINTRIFLFIVSTMVVLMGILAYNANCARHFSAFDYENSGFIWALSLFLAGEISVALNDILAAYYE